jgi:hypothetical protein
VRRYSCIKGGTSPPDFHHDGTMAEYVDYRHYEDLKNRYDALASRLAVLEHRIPPSRGAADASGAESTADPST